MIEIVNLRANGGRFIDPKGMEYIGRVNRWCGRKGSPLANPFRIGIDGTRDECVTKYESWLREQIYFGKREVLDELARLASIIVTTGGVRLACFCAPQRCHGDVIKRALEEVLTVEDVG